MSRRPSSPSFVDRHGSVDRRAIAGSPPRSSSRSSSASSNWCASPSPISTAFCAARPCSPAKPPSAMKSGVNMTTTLLAKDTSHKTVFPVFTAGGGFDMPEMQGGADFVMVPDPATFRVLPWAPNTGWLLCDIYFANGKPVPFSSRRLYREALTRLATAGFDFLAGLEVEFHLFRITNPRLAPEDATWPPAAARRLAARAGLSAPHRDALRPDRSRRSIRSARPSRRSACRCVRSKSELGPSQVEFTFRTLGGIDAADTMVLFRSAVKQVARRNGCLASFMCRPALPNMMSSGWHLHQSLIEHKRKINAFALNDRDVLSTVGPLLSRRADRSCARRRRLLHADHQRLQALPPYVARAGPRHLGARQSRRDGARDRPAWRPRDASGKSDRRAGRQSVSLHGVADLCGARRHCAAARSGSVSRCALRT